MKPTAPAVSTNQVRQILFNELGLTREYIRELVREAVTQTIGAYFNSSQLDKFIRDEVDKALRTYHYGSGELKALIAAAVAEGVRKQIMEKLDFSIEVGLLK